MSTAILTFPKFKPYFSQNSFILIGQGRKFCSCYGYDRLPPSKDAIRKELNRMQDIDSVKTYFENLQEQVCEAFEGREPTKRFSCEEIDSENGAQAKPKVLDDGVHVEKGAVQYTYSKGTKLPAAATERNQSLSGKSFEAARANKGASNAAQRIYSSRIIRTDEQADSASRDSRRKCFDYL